jgi:hypothetical protein
MNHESLPAISSLFPYSVKSDASGRKGVGVRKAPSAASSNGLTERSVFHEPWWLDIATGGEWKAAVVKSGGELIGEMPYSMNRKGIWHVSTLPPLTRSLGPVIKPSQSASGQDWRHRLSVCNELIVQLPSCARVHQILDPRITEALAFSVQGFAVSATYTLQITPDCTEADIWSGMRPNTRNMIRRAAEKMTVLEIRNANEFADFYEVNLEHRKQKNMYGPVMRQLVNEFVRRKAGLLLGAYGDDGSLSAAIALVWDSTTIYYLLSSRSERTHAGSISLLLWTAIRVAREQDKVFDFDGIGSPGILKFLSGFGGTLVQRLEVERLRADYAALRAVRRGAKAVSTETYRTWRWPLETSA